MKRYLAEFAALTVLFGGIGQARADITQVDMFRNNEYIQAGNGNTVSYAGAFFSADLFSTANAFTSASMTYPGPGSPVGLPAVNSTTFQYQTGFFATQAAMDAAFPMGAYSFAALGTPSGSTSFSYSSDAYPQSQPFLAGNTYSNLQGMNAAAAFTFQFSPFTTGVLADASYVDFTIFDQTTNTFAYINNFLAPTTTSLLLPANTLTPGDQYTAELIFDNRNFVASPGADSQASIGFELRDEANFTAAPRSASTPEPQAITLLGLGIGGLLGYARLRRGRRLYALAR
jgi:hypothetical protein